VFVEPSPQLCVALGMNVHLHAGKNSQGVPSTIVRCTAEDFLGRPTVRILAQPHAIFLAVWVWP
jgi:hypothetical protein